MKFPIIKSSDMIKIRQFSSNEFSLEAMVSKEISITLNLPAGATILGATIYAQGGMPFYTSINGITSELIKVFARSDSVMSNRTIRAVVFYK